MILYLAGAETWFQHMVDADVDNMLFSYFYTRSMRHTRFKGMLEVLYDAQSKRVAAGKKPLRFFLDSGAFTWLFHDGKKPPIEKYASDLISFVRDTAGLWTAVAELDVDDPGQGMATSEDTHRWRCQLLDATGGATPVVRVWHPFHSRDTWLEMVEDPVYPYIAIGSDQPKKTVLLAEAHRGGKAVHGFAETKLQTESKYLKYDSVDSTTWVRATKYGGFFVFHGNQLRILDHKHKADRRLFKAYFKQNGLDMDKIMREDQDELTKSSLIAWRNMARRYEAQGAFDERNGPRVYAPHGAEAGDEVDAGLLRARTVTPNSAVRGHEAAAEDRRRVAESALALHERGGVQPSGVRAAPGAGELGGPTRVEPRRITGVPGAARPTQDPADAQGRRDALAERDGDDDRGALRSADLGPRTGRAGAVDPIDGVHDPRTEFGDARAQLDARVDSAAGQRIGVPSVRRGVEAAVDRAAGEDDQGRGEARGGHAAAGGAKPAHEVGERGRPGHPGSAPVKGRLVIRGGKIVPLAAPQHAVPSTVQPDRPPVKERPRSRRSYEGIHPEDPTTWVGSDGLPRCIPARNTGHEFSRAEITQTDAIGNRLGCAHCASAEPKDRRGNGRWIKDHMPPSDDLGPCTTDNGHEEGWRACTDPDCARHNTPQVLIPSCEDCSLSQGGGRNVSVYTKPEQPKVRAVSTGTWRTEDGPQLDLPIAEGAQVADLLESAGLKVTRGGEATLEAIAEAGNREGAHQVLDTASIQPLPSPDPTIGMSEPGHTQSSLPSHLPESIQVDTGGLSPSKSLPIYGQVYTPSDSAARGLSVLRSLPKTVCSNCAMSAECPEFVEGSACAFTKAFGALQVRDIGHLMAMREAILEREVERTQRGFLMEALTAGGQIDPRVSHQSDRLMAMLDQWENLRNTPNAPPVKFSAHVQTPDGSVSVQGTGRQGPAQGILTRLFGAPTETMATEPARSAEPVDVQGAIDTTAVPKA